MATQTVFKIESEDGTRQVRNGSVIKTKSGQVFYSKSSAERTLRTSKCTYYIRVLGMKFKVKEYELKEI